MKNETTNQNVLQARKLGMPAYRLWLTMQNELRCSFTRRHLHLPAVGWLPDQARAAHPRSHASELGVPRQLLEVQTATQRPCVRQSLLKSNQSLRLRNQTGKSCSLEQQSTLLLVYITANIHHVMLCHAMLCQIFHTVAWLHDCQLSCSATRFESL